MFRSESSDGMLQAIASIAILALLFWSLGLPALRFADAANLTLVSDTIGDSTPSATTDHEIEFTVPTGSTGLASGDTLTITFANGFTGTSTVTFTDVDLVVNAGNETIVNGAAGANDWGFTFVGQSLILEAGSAESLSADDEVIVRVGSNATGGTDRLINPGSEGSYDIDIVLENSDTGSTKVAIINGVTVSASVDTIFTFSVSGLPSGSTIPGGTTSGDTTTTTIPFGTLTDGNATTSAQLLTVSTNAANGYTVTVQSDGDLQSSTGATIDSFRDGSNLNVPEAWAVPSATLGQNNTYGHWGVTSDDTVAGRGSEFSGGDNYIGISSTTAHIVMGHTGPANGAGVGVGTTTVGFQVEISALQEAGDDYEAVLTYVATPTF